MRSSFSIIALVTATALLPMPSIGAGMAGFWEFNIDLGGLEIEANCNLAENSGKLTGRCWSDAGPFRYDAEASGTVQGDRIDLSYSFPSERGRVTFRYKGQMEPDMSLTGDFLLSPGEDGQASKGLFAAAKSR